MQHGQVKGRTLVKISEAVAALIILAVLAVVVIPATRTLRRHNAIRLLTEHGIRLRTAIVDANQAAYLAEDMSPLWPTNRHLSSTAFFQEFFTSELYTNAFPAEWFAAPGVPAFAGTDVADFAASNNVWCFVCPEQDQTNDVPFIFTRNFSAGEERGARIGDVRRLDPREPPFGDHAGIVVTFRGEARVVRAKDIVGDVSLSALFNPTAATNLFLAPSHPSEPKRKRK